jgi:hypothetical protein
LDLRKTGEITGKTTDSPEGKGPYLVVAESIDLAQKQSRSARIERPGPFALSQLMEGKYTVSGFEDTDGSGKYSFGVPFPFRPAERFAVAADTLRVRARWGIEGVLLPFK